MKRWKRVTWWAYLALIHAVIGAGVVAWGLGLVVRPWDTHHLELRTTTSEVVARALGGVATRDDRAHVVSFKGRNVLVIGESEKEGLDEIEVSPPGSKVVWTFSYAPIELSGLPSEWTVGIQGMTSDTPLGPERGRLEWIMVDTNADGMPDGRRKAEPGAETLRLRRDVWVSKDDPNAAADPR